MAQPRCATWALLTSLLVLAYGCSSTPSQPAARGTVTLGPTPEAETVSEPLPDLPVEQIRSEDGGRLIERLETQGDDVRLILRSIAQSYGLGYEIAPAVRGPVSVSLANATLEQALDAVVLPLGHTYTVQGNVLRVGPARFETRIFGLDFISLSRLGTGTTTVQRRLGPTGGRLGSAGSQAATGIGGLGGPGGGDAIVTSQVSDLWREITVALEALIFSSSGLTDLDGLDPGGQAGGVAGQIRSAPGAVSRVDSAGRQLIVNPIAGTVLVTATPDELDSVETYVQAFESAIQRQVRIEAKFVEVVLDRDFEFGIDWSVIQRVGDVAFRSNADPLGQSGVQFVLGSGGQQISAVLEALETQGDVSVLSSPTISTLNNQRAVFNVTTDEIFFAVTRQPIFGPTGATIGFDTQVETQPIAVGIVMDVLPQISADNTITMNVRPMVTNLVRVEEITQEGATATAPVVDRREIDTMVRARTGETIVIGGLIQTRRERRRTGVPVLMDIPVLGALFGRTRDTERRGELVIFITPMIIANTAPVAP